MPSKHAHYVIVAQPPEPARTYKWPSVNIQLERAEFYLDGWVMLRVAAPMWYRPYEVAAAFKDWGDLSCDLLDGGFHFPVGSVWSNYQYRAKLLDAMLARFQHEIDSIKDFQHWNVDK